MLHVGTYLMCTAGFQTALHQRYGTEALQNSPVGDGMFADVAVLGKYSHAQAVLWVTADVACDSSLVLSEWTPYESVVQTSCGVVEKLLAERSLCLWGLCHNQQAACILVYSVYKPYLRVVGVVSRIVLQMPCQSIYQRAAEVSASRVYHHTGGFVDEQKLVVLIHHIQGNVFWYYLPITFGSVEHQRDDVAGLYLVVALYRFAVGHNVAGFGCLLYAVAACVAQMVHQELVHTDGVLTAVCHHTAMLVELCLTVLVLDVLQVFQVFKILFLACHFALA